MMSVDQIRDACRTVIDANTHYPNEWYVHNDLYRRYAEAFREPPEDES